MTPLCRLKTTVTPVKEDGLLRIGHPGAALLEPKTGPSRVSPSIVSAATIGRSTLAADKTGASCAKARRLLHEMPRLHLYPSGYKRPVGTLLSGKTGSLTATAQTLPPFQALLR